MVTSIEQFTTKGKAAPRAWRQPSSQEDSKLHQLAPYIGKLKPVIARQLLRRFTAKGDTVLDCFSGSGTIALESALLGRRVLAFDSNPYAIALTRAKLEAPSSLEEAGQNLSKRLIAAEGRPRPQIHQVPDWVRKFFHPETLLSALRFADECIEQDDRFLLACLLSILHHQRPGFLSYPSSHLVPYLRDQKFPRCKYPDLYMERTLAPRLAAKLARIYKTRVVIDTSAILQVDRIGIAELKLDQEVDAIVTSPPYMNALDYVRDNRLRLWFLDRRTADYSPEPTDKQVQSDSIAAAFSRNALKYLRPGGYCVLIVGETVLRKRIASHPAERIYARLCADFPELRVEEVIKDKIPDVRRSRKSGAATKRELILVLKRE